MATSYAAIADLTIPTPVLQSDNLLSFILALLPSLQVKLSTPKKGTSMTLSTNDGTTVITSRNATLRTLSSLSLLNRLDNYPFLLLGGYAEGETSSSEAAMVLASISSYMSIASMIRSNDEKEAHILTSLDEILATNSFLVGNTTRPTLADYDVFYALAERYGDNDLAFKSDVFAKGMINLRRWVLAVQASVEELVHHQASNIVQNVKIPFVDFGIVDPVPVFFYGDDDDGAAATSADSSYSAPVPAGDKVEAAAPAGKDAGGKKELTEEEKKATADKRAKKAAEKKAKKGTQSNTGGKTGGGDGVSPAAELNVSALDIRVGKIIDVWEHEGSEKLWCEKIDLGEAEPRQILSGLRAFYKKEEIQDRYVLVLCNLKKRNLVGVPSHGMVLCASNADHTAVEFVIPPEGVKVGERVTFDGFAGEPESENKVAKKKILEKLAPDLKTNNDGVVVWKGIKCETSAGPCVASKGMKDAQVS
eukprot:scaffold4141_cov199-Chaetoceros_neogracile.AAC.2